MCGICGIYTTSPVREYEEDIIAMVGSMQHRGPDDSGWERISGAGGEQVYLGNARLSVIDTSPLGHQPMTSAGGDMTIVYNGEIYNFPEIKRILTDKGYSFRSGTDTEVLLYAYSAWGEKALDLLDGMFAFAIWDRRKGELFLARDRLGIKPLYYAVRGGVVAFASEIKSLHSTGFIETRFDPSGLADFLTFQFTIAPRTIFTGVSKMLPGSSLTIKNGTLTGRTYWKLEKEEQTGRTVPIEEYEELLLSKLREAVRQRLISDVPLGTFLSGGLDSSLITGLMAELAGGTIKTFSMGFPSPGEESYNELDYARRVARYFGTDHHEFRAGPDDIAHSIEKITYHFDEPFGGGLHTYFISALAREHVTVVLSGLGGDELFAGYEWNRMAKIMRHYSRIPAVVRQKILGPAFEPFPSKPFEGGFIQRMKKLSLYNSLNPDEWYPLWIQVFNPEQTNLLMNNGRGLGSGGHDPRSTFRNYCKEVPDWSTQDRLLYLQIKTTMVDDFLNYTDKMSMAHSLECRVPFLDHELVEFSMSIPFRYKMRWLEGKHILRRCARTILPADIVDRSKQGFIMPVDVWMRGALKPLILDCLLGTGDGNDEILNRTMVQKIAGEFFDKGKPLGRQVWSLFTFKLWKEIFQQNRATRTRKAQVYGKTR